MAVEDFATSVQSTFGDAFTAEITELKVAEKRTAPSGNILPQPLDPAGMPGGTAPPSDIIDLSNHVFYLGLDLRFVGNKLFTPGTPNKVDIEVAFFLEGMGMLPRQEVNIAPQTFRGLAVSATSNQYELWVQVSGNGTTYGWPGIVANPTQSGTTPSAEFEQLFLSGTIYRISATVKITPVDYVPMDAILNGFIEGLVASTK